MAKYNKGQEEHIMDKDFIKDSIFSSALKERVKRIQNGEEEMDGFISAYQPFILSVARKCSNKNYITESDDEYSIALMAFAEAIKAYRGEKGNFLSFSKNIIKMRCIDYYRREKRYAANISFEDSSENDAENASLYRQSLEQYENEKRDNERALEIEQFKSELQKWGISLSDLVQVSPKQAKTREMCRAAICYLSNNNEILEYIFERQILPLAQIQKDTGIPRKQLERIRKYIIAALIIKSGDYPFLSEYVADRGCDE